MNQPDGMTVTFRCPPELESILPRPVPAVLGLPDWFKALPQKAFNPILQDDQFTVKKCPPFIDAMTYRLSAAAGGRPQGRERRILLGPRRAVGRTQLLWAVADRFP